MPYGDTGEKKLRWSKNCAANKLLISLFRSGTFKAANYSAVDIRNSHKAFQVYGRKQFADNCRNTAKNIILEGEKTIAEGKLFFVPFYCTVNLFLYFIRNTYTV